MERQGMVRRPKSEALVSGTKAILDMAAWVVALYVAAWVRLDLDFSWRPGRTFIFVLAFAAGLQAVVGWAIGLYRFRWMYGAFDEVAALVPTVAFTSLATFAMVSNVNPRPVPRSSALAGGAVALVGMAGVRYTARLLRERWRRPDPDHPDAIRTIVFGAGNAGEQIIRSMLRDQNSRYVPVALLDDDPAKRRLSISGVRVSGTRADLERVAEDTAAGALLIATPSADSHFIAELTDLAERFALQVKVLPAVDELIDGTVRLADIRDVSEEDLLGRHQVQTDLEQVAGYLRGRRVLVTGAGGSIGSELCRQIHRFSPSELMMLDRDESALFAVQLSIEGRALLDTPSLILADIRDDELIRRIFAERKPEVVFHAAALKHLTLLERYPAEAVKTNVIGTFNVLDAAVRTGVTHFVNISTDKAADPSSVLGYSKRVAERFTANIALKASGQYMSVRFGNVLGSRGSFLHAFRAQIEQGGPVTVTDRDVTRYFMTIPEAVELVIQAGAIGSNGNVLILDMGEPVRIADVARRMIKQSRRDIRIVYTGLRPGEKLHEDLRAESETRNPTVHPLISSSTVNPVGTEILDEFDPAAQPPQKVIDLLADWCTGI